MLYGYRMPQLAQHKMRDLVTRRQNRFLYCLSVFIYCKELSSAELATKYCETQSSVSFNRENFNSIALNRLLIS